ncbi:MAG: DUF1273 family protein [Ruminococcaceae bacterium]|nr:DUF1273 family protein [Oscillospiraceae bacterium]
MKNYVCSSFGHRDIQPDMNILNSTLESLILTKKINIFITGGMGIFDSCFTSSVKKLKQKYPHIKLFLIKPYFSSELNKNKEYYTSQYDDIIIPESLAFIHPKSAIYERNKWMIDNSDIVVFNIQHNYGGAYKAFEYSVRTGKNIINIYNKY